MDYLLHLKRRNDITLLWLRLYNIYSQDCEKDKGKERPPDLRNILASAAEQRMGSATKSVKKAKDTTSTSGGGRRDNEEKEVREGHGN